MRMSNGFLYFFVEFFRFSDTNIKFYTPSIIFHILQSRRSDVSFRHN